MAELVIDPQDGTAPLVLSWQAGYAVQPGPLGLGVPPRQVVERVRGDGHGSDLVGTRVGPRDVTIPLDVYGATRDEFRARRRRLQTICGRSTHARPLRVTYREDGGVAEWIEGVYVGGLEGDESKADERSEMFAVVLRDGNPYWRGPLVEHSWSLQRARQTNWFPLLGRWPSSSLVGGRHELIVPGDVEVRPPWVVQGPGADLAIINHTAGWEVLIDHELTETGPGAVLTVNTGFGAQSVRDGYGVNLFGAITNGPDGGWEMGPLLPGANDVEVRLAGSTAASSVLVAYNPLLLAA